MNDRYLEPHNNSIIIIHDSKTVEQNQGPIEGDETPQNLGVLYIILSSPRRERRSSSSMHFVANAACTDIVLPYMRLLAEGKCLEQKKRRKKHTLCFPLEVSNYT